MFFSRQAHMTYFISILFSLLFPIEGGKKGVVADLKQDTHTEVNSCCYVPPLDFKSDAYWNYTAQIMFIVVGIFNCSQKNTCEISVYSRSKCSGSLCCWVQAVSEHWEHLGCRSSAVGIGKSPLQGFLNSSCPAASGTSETYSDLGRSGLEAVAKPR